MKKNKNKNKNFNKLILKKIIRLQNETNVVLNVFENFIDKNNKISSHIHTILKKRGVTYEQKNIKKN